MKKTLLSLSLIALLAGCFGNEASDSELESQRGIANDNSKGNAQKWRADNGFEKLLILGRGDSTQQKRCPQGDGWATIDLVDPGTKQPVIKLKCSTYSSSIGCYKDEDFKARAQLAKQDNTCNDETPKTLKKIVE